MPYVGIDDPGAELDLRGDDSPASSLDYEVDPVLSALCSEVADAGLQRLGEAADGERGERLEKGAEQGPVAGGDTARPVEEVVGIDVEGVGGQPGICQVVLRTGCEAPER